MKKKSFLFIDNEEEDGEKAARTGEEAPLGDEMETEDLMLSLTGSNAISNRYKWQRSRWLRLDPVALKQGNRVPGRQDLAVQYVNIFYPNLNTKIVLFSLVLWTKSSFCQVKNH